jgi:hypothetical protein
MWKVFFWTGQGKLKSAVGDWQDSLKKLFVLAGHAGKKRTPRGARFSAMKPHSNLSAYVPQSSSRTIDPSLAHKAIWLSFFTHASSH